MPCVCERNGLKLNVSNFSGPFHSLAELSGCLTYDLLKHYLNGVDIEAAESFEVQNMPFVKADALVQCINLKSLTVCDKLESLAFVS